jgi:hypothetical protein
MNRSRHTRWRKSAHGCAETEGSAVPTTSYIAVR